jgi:hypothetical protein
LHQILWTMPTSGIVPIPCAAATEGVVQLTADSKRLSKLSGAWACCAARRKVLEHVALGHRNRVVQRKSPPLVGVTSLPVALLLSSASAAASPPMSMVVATSLPPYIVGSTHQCENSPQSRPCARTKLYHVEPIHKCIDQSTMPLSDPLELLPYASAPR